METFQSFLERTGQLKVSKSIKFSMNFFSTFLALWWILGAHRICPWKFCEDKLNIKEIIEKKDCPVRSPIFGSFHPKTLYLRTGARNLNFSSDMFDSRCLLVVLIQK